MRLSILTSLLAVALSSTAHAFDFHVDPATGDDIIGDGSPALPWKTLTRAVRVLRPPGSCPAVFWLAPGSYDAASGEEFPLLQWDLGYCYDVTVRGDSSGGTVFRPDGATAFQPVGFEGFGTIRLEHLHLDATAATALCPAGIDGSGIDEVLVSDCVVEGFAMGILVSGPPLDGTGHSSGQSVRFERSRLVGNDIGVAIYAAPSPFGTALGYLDADLINNVITGNRSGVELTLNCPAPCYLGFDPFLLHNTLAGQAESAVVGCARMDGNVLAFNGGFGVRDGCVGAGNDFWANALGDSSSGPLPPGNRTADPLFVDASAGDFHLQAGSPCLDVVLDDPDVREDFDRRARPLDGDGDGVAVSDAGAFERDGVQIRLDLLRFDFLSLDPLAPDRAQAFPLDATNPGARVAVSDFVSGATEFPPPGVALSFYGLDPAIPRTLFATKACLGCGAVWRLR